MHERNPLWVDVRRVVSREWEVVTPSNSGLERIGEGPAVVSATVSRVVSIGRHKEEALILPKQSLCLFAC